MVRRRCSRRQTSRLYQVLLRPIKPACYPYPNRTFRGNSGGAYQHTPLFRPGPWQWASIWRVSTFVGFTSVVGKNSQQYHGRVRNAGQREIPVYKEKTENDFLSSIPVSTLHYPHHVLRAWRVRKCRPE